jgi:hypothetical protein
MNFEVGKHYRTRGGDCTVEIIAIRHDLGTYPIIGITTTSDGYKDIETYQINGRYYDLNADNNSCDLTEEVPAP